MTLLQLEQLSKHFSGLVAVDRIDLTLDEGEILGLIGPNGAGKTTVFNMISGSLSPTRGRIVYNGDAGPGVEIAANGRCKAPHHICRLGIVRTFQIARPFAHLSVLDNVKVGAYLRHRHSAEAEARAREVLAFTGLQRQAHMPASSLTTAGRKRLELARALSTGPRLLLLDEVMAGLTPTESVAIVRLIQEIRDTGVTLLVIEHVMRAVMTLSDRIAVLHHGQLLAVDTPAGIANNDEVIEAYLGEEASKWAEDGG